MSIDQKAIESILRELEDTWRRNDSVTYASHFAEDATFIQIFGGQLDGRAAIEASHRIIFDTIYKGSYVTFAIRTIRPLGPGTAVVFTRSLLRFQQGGDARELETRPTFVFMKEQDSGQWRIVAFQNTRVSEMPEPARAAGRLAS